MSETGPTVLGDARVEAGEVRVAVTAGSRPEALILRLGTREVGRLTPDNTDPGTYSGPLPASSLESGIMVLLITTKDATTTLGALPVIIGRDLPDGAALATEVALLRAELDLLKSAFRRSQRL